MMATKKRGNSLPGGESIPAADAQSVPMIRLFDQRDIEFLRSVAGYTADMEIGFRRRRCRIFREYLRSLRAEFAVAQMEMETLQIESPDDHRQLASMLLRCRMHFAWALIPSYLCLFRYRWDICGNGLPAVVQRFENIRAEIRRWIPGVC